MKSVEQIGFLEHYLKLEKKKEKTMFQNLVLILICISYLLIRSKALECNWMSCYTDELEECKKATSKSDCFRGVLVTYREAPLFMAKKKCCDKFNIEAIRDKFLCKLLFKFNFDLKLDLHLDLDFDLNHDLSFNLIINFFIDCVKKLQNGTHLCESYAEREVKISTKNNCNKFGCTLINKNSIIPENDDEDDDDDETESPYPSSNSNEIRKYSTTKSDRTIWNSSQTNNSTVPYPSRYHELSEESTESPNEIN